MLVLLFNFSLFFVDELSEDEEEEEEGKAVDSGDANEEEAATPEVEREDRCGDLFLRLLL